MLITRMFSGEEGDEERASVFAKSVQVFCTTLFSYFSNVGGIFDVEVTRHI